MRRVECIVSGVQIVESGKRFSGALEKVLLRRKRRKSYLGCFFFSLSFLFSTYFKYFSFATFFFSQAPTFVLS